MPKRNCSNKIETKNVISAVAGIKNPTPTFMFSFMVKYRYKHRETLRILVGKLPSCDVKSKPLYPYHLIKYIL